MMFDDIGVKIQIYARRFFYIFLTIEAIAAVVLFFIFAAEDILIALIAVGAFVLCVLADALIAFPIYAFGQLVDDVHHMRMRETQSMPVNTDELPDL